MSGRSLPPVSAKVIADIEQFVSEFKRAENVTRRTSATINQELSDLAKKTAKKFELGDIGKDLLKGAGLFGGLEIARTASEAIVGHFREAAEHAKSMEASAERQLDLTRKLISLRQTDDQRLDVMKKERDHLTRTLADLQKVETIKRRVGSTIRGEDFRRDIELCETF